MGRGWVWGVALLPAQFPHLQGGRSSHCTWWAAVEGQGEATKPGEVEGQQGTTGLAEIPGDPQGDAIRFCGASGCIRSDQKVQRETKACQRLVCKLTVAAFIIRLEIDVFINR